MKRVSHATVSTSLIIALTFMGCGGANPNPIATYLPGDEDMSCAALEATVANIDRNVAELETMKTVKAIGNTINFVGGFWTLGIMWLFMDLKHAEQVESEAFRRRKDVLSILASEKNCSFWEGGQVSREK